MSLRPSLIGMIEIDASAGASFVPSSCPPSRFSAVLWLESIAKNPACAVVTADLALLRDELDGEFRRLQARLAAEARFVIRAS